MASLKDQRTSREGWDGRWSAALGTEVSVCSWGATPGTGTGQDQVALVVRASILFF